MTHSTHKGARLLDRWMPCFAAHLLSALGTIVGLYAFVRMDTSSCAYVGVTSFIAGAAAAACIAIGIGISVARKNGGAS